MFYPLLFAFIFALIFAALLPGVLRREGPGPMNGILFFFVIIFLFSWGIGSWVEPIEPVAYDTSWVGFLLIALFAMLLIAALVPARDPEPRTPLEEAAKKEAEEQAATAVGLTFGAFFWILMIGLLIAGILSLIF